MSGTTSTKRRILVQLDPDPHASVFDAVVAVDSGVDHLFQYKGVEPTQVQGLVHGAMFTRGPQDLKSTAIFVGGSNVALGETLLARVVECFFGPMRVSVMLDANGANTTAAAAVLAAGKHVPLSGAVATVLGATGPVGQRAALLLARAGATVRCASRSQDRAQSVCQAIAARISGARLSAHATGNEAETVAAVGNASIVIAAGAAGVVLLDESALAACGELKVAVDLNAVPPLGVAGVQAMDKAKDRGGLICYGALGVGGSKMKIHKAAVARLFESNDAVLDAAEIYELGKSLG